ncbi:MAG: hypothetical protein HC845_10715 [Akkermansiaceae bacterium]|nr:hypothetical protein [Akkermansiaceae bacterium]
MDDHARKAGKNFKQTLNHAVRLGLGKTMVHQNPGEFKIDARPMQLKAGGNAGMMNSLLDEMDGEVYLQK